MFEALVAAVEVAATEPEAAAAPPTIGGDAAPVREWTPPADAPWRGGTLDTVAQLADMCGGVVSDELLAPEDRTRVFARRLARAGQLAGSSYTDGRLVAAALDQDGDPGLPAAQTKKEEPTMVDVIVNLMYKYQVLVMVGFGFATAGLMLWAFVKTRSAPAVLGMAAVGIGAMVLVANMTTVANRFGEDVLGNETITIEQVTGRSAPGQSSTAPGGGGTPTTVPCDDEFSPGSC
ncbi:MAG: hypothetical protein OXM57_14530 [bacterium]|nr:hypothetical protein [bacterium]